MAKLIDKVIGIMGFSDEEPEEDIFEENEREKNSAIYRTKYCRFG